MKKIRKYGIILFAGLCACAAWSCEEDKTDRKFTPKDPVIKLGGDVEVGKAGGSYTVPIESNLPWRVRSEADWILLGEVENGMGDGDHAAQCAVEEHQRQLHPRGGRHLRP